MDGKYFEDISCLDLDCFIRWGSIPAIEELCCGDRGAHAGGNEGESNEPTVTKTVGHRLAESRDEDHESLREENDEESDGRVQHSLLRLPGHSFVTEAENEDHAADDDRCCSEDAEEVHHRINGIEDESP